MTYQPPHEWDNTTTQPVTAPKTKTHPVGLYILGAFVVMALLCMVGVTIAAVNATDDTPKTKAPALAVPDTGVWPTPNVPTKTLPPPAAKSTLTKDDVELSVKITDKQCFGSAGCNVQWEIKAAVDGGKNTTKVAPGDTCAVTYRMRGLEDTKVGTITVNDDGTYTNEDWSAFGQTKRSSAKVTAEVTEVECR